MVKRALQRISAPAQQVCETKAVYFRDPVKANVCYRMSVVTISCDQVKSMVANPPPNN